jgi:hypothetical protein
LHNYGYIKVVVNFTAEYHNQYASNTTRTQYLYYLNTVAVSTPDKAAQSASCDHDVYGGRAAAINWKIKYALPVDSCDCVPVYSKFFGDTQCQMSNNLII